MKRIGEFMALTFCMFVVMNISGQPLVKLFDNNDLEKFKRLVKEKPAQIFNHDKDGCNIIHILCLSDRMDAQVYLAAVLENVPKLDLDSMTCLDGTTPLSIAVISNSTGIMKMLIDKGADINKADKDSLFPLLYGLHKSSMETIEYILSLNPDVKLKSGSGVTSLMVACFRGNKKVVDKIISLGSDITAMDNRGNTALNIACNPAQYSGDYHPNPEILQLLLSSGLNPNNKNNDGTTPLMSSMATGKEELVQLLINNGARINDQDNDGWTPLMYAAANRKWEVLKTLANHGVDTEVADKEGKTALMYAAAAGDIMFVEKLVKIGARPDAVDKKGRNALYYAKINKCKNIEQYFRSSGK